MANKTLEEKIVKLWNVKQSRHFISDTLCVPRTTVRRYINRLLREKVIVENAKQKPKPRGDGFAPVNQLKKDDVIWLANHRCRHDKNYLEHYACFLEENPSRERVGYLDIETSGLKANWAIMLTSCILDGDTDEVLYSVITKEDLLEDGLDRRIVQETIDNMTKFDRVYTFFGTHFDLKFLRTRAVIHNLEFPTFQSILHTDLYYLIKSRFLLHSNRLAVACENLLGSTEKNQILPSYWIKALQGDSTAISYILDHNMRDVRELKRLHEKVKTYHGQRDNSI